MIVLKVKRSLTKILIGGSNMGEGISLGSSYIHKICGKGELVRYGGGDITIYCEYCIRKTGEKKIVDEEDILEMKKRERK